MNLKLWKPRICFAKRSVIFHLIFGLFLISNFSISLVDFGTFCFIASIQFSVNKIIDNYTEFSSEMFHYKLNYELRYKKLLTETSICWPVLMAHIFGTHTSFNNLNECKTNHVRFGFLNELTNFYRWKCLKHRSRTHTEHTFL